MFLPEFLRVSRLAVCHIDLTGLGIIYDAVSYTHLDVYKRQFVNGVNAINDCGAGAYRNQRIHVRRAVEQGLSLIHI